MEDKKNKPFCKTCPYLGRVEVPYSGSKKTDIIFVGEAPGETEMKLGEPFVGDSGKLLDKLLASIKISRSSVLITNSCRCYIDKEKDPIKTINTALANCRKYLEVVIKSIKPKLIVCLGAYALKQILGKQKILENRGKFFFSDEFNCHVFVTVHPAYILRKGVSPIYPNIPIERMNATERLLFSDFKMIYEFMNNGATPKSINTDNYVEIEDYVLPEGQTYFAFDLETTSAKHFNQDFRLLSCAISTEEGSSRVLVFDEGKQHNLKSIMEDENIEKVVASRPFDEVALQITQGIDVKGKIHDVLVMAHLVDENYKQYSLQEIANVYTDLKNIKQLSYDYRVNKMAEMPKDLLIKYNGCDADATLRCFNVLRKKIQDDTKLDRYYNYLVIPALDLFKDMYVSGCFIDRKALFDSKVEARRLLFELEQKALSLVHKDIIKDHEGKLKLSRNELIKDILFTHPKGYKLKPDVNFLTTKTKEPQITEEHLSLFKDNLFVKVYMDWKKLSKIYTTYLNKLENFIYNDGYVHHQTLINRTVSGRTVILDPPLQTIPQRHPYAYLIKRCFSAEDGWLLCIRDLSQSEFRIIGWIAGDNNILQAVNSGIDLHTKTASVVNKIPIDQVTKEMRQKAKGVGFGLIYGMSAGGLQQYLADEYDLHYSYEECAKFREAFFSKPDGYWKLTLYYKYQETFVTKHGFVRSPLGRIRRLPEAQSQDKSAVSRAIRQAINFPVSSFSSDLGLIGAFLFNREIKTNPKYKNKVKPMIFIHDSFMFRAEEDLIDECALLLKECMCERSKEYIKKHFNINVGYKIDSDRKQGKVWADLKEVKD